MTLFRSLTIALCLSSPALAQNFTTASEVKPILTATKGVWVAVREYDGRDLVYFTQILSWRCGLTEFSYQINGGEAQVFPAAPCHEDTPTPNAILAGDPDPYISEPLGSVETVTVTLTYDDGTEDSADYERAAVLMP